MPSDVREDVVILFLAALVAATGYLVSSFFGPQHGLSVGVSASLILIGAKLYRAEAEWYRLLGSLIMATGAGVFVTTMLDAFAGAVASLLLLVYFLVRVLSEK